MERIPFKPGRESVTGRALLERTTVQILDAQTDPEYKLNKAQRLGGYRSMIGAPLLREGTPIGVFGLSRHSVRPFSDKQMTLLTTFADQAVIAIENARLFEEVQARTRELTESLQQQTATADVLKIISRSSVDLETVLDTLVDTVARLCHADHAAMFRRQDDKYHLVAARGLSAEGEEFVLTHPVTDDRGTLNGRVAAERRPVHIPDVLQDPEYTYREGQTILGYRTMLGIPLLREQTLIGIFSINRTRVEPFTDKEIELASSFADQAVIAIENARLFEELQDRQAELRVTFDNMGDGVVMFDAEARLTAWNRNFQEMLELPDAFLSGRPSFAEFFRYLADRGEYVSTDLEAQLSRTIEDTSREMRFERTRPDGRVIEVRRNPVAGGGFVLIYSDITERKHAEDREGSGERRPVNLNALVDESLNLAYHGARAENQEFKIRLERSFDPTTGEVDLFPQEITRALLNLISNGFYAATKRKAKIGFDEYEPTLSVATKNLGNSVEITIRDNGGGIPPEVREKMFNPFFTTKPPGEGTGLGLSLSYDIVVKQHAGSIEVDTQPGEFTEFKVILPRMAATSKAGADK
jgi:PAS domain S-box-containing protein